MFSGAQISLYPMTDDFVGVILGALGALDPYRDRLQDRDRRHLDLAGRAARGAVSGHARPVRRGGGDAAGTACSMRRCRAAARASRTIRSAAPTPSAAPTSRWRAGKAAALGAVAGRRGHRPGGRRAVLALCRWAPATTWTRSMAASTSSSSRRLRPVEEFLHQTAWRCRRRSSRRWPKRSAASGRPTAM